MISLESSFRALQMGATAGMAAASTSKIPAQLCYIGLYRRLSARLYYLRRSIREVSPRSF